MKKKMVPAGILALAICLLFIHACKKQAFFADETAIINLSAVSSAIDLGESVRIHIIGYNENGTLLWNGTRIELSIENGTLDLYSVELEDGKATVTAAANMNRGDMKIKARSGNAIALPNPLIIKVGQLPEVNQLVVNLAPPILPATGGRMEIIVHVYDAYMAPIQGLGVILESTGGTLVSKGAPLTTDASGMVVDYLDTTKAGVITIYAGNKTRTVNVILEE